MTTNANEPRDDLKRGELACVLNCLREILRPQEYSVARVINNFGRDEYRIGDWVLVSRVTKSECVIEHAMTPSEIAKQKANGSLLRTWIVMIEFPVAGVKIEIDRHWRGAEGEVAELRRQVAAANDRVRIVLDSMKWNGDGYDWTGGEFDYRMDPAKAVTNTERLVASLRQRAESLEQRIALAGGYHARTPREIEIEEALRCVDPADAGPEDVAIEELLALVDAGRNRVHEEIEKRESAEQQLAEARRHLACALGQDKPRPGDWHNWLDREEDSEFKRMLEENEQLRQKLAAANERTAELAASAASEIEKQILVGIGRDSIVKVLLKHFSALKEPTDASQT